jgi:hypothetical protein
MDGIESGNNQMKVKGLLDIISGDDEGVEEILAGEIETEEEERESGSVEIEKEVVVNMEQ